MPNKNQIYHVIGLMSGTSLDGMDIAYCTFEWNDPTKSWSYNIIRGATVSYNDYWYNQLLNSMQLNKKELALLDDEYGIWIGQQVLKFINEHQLTIDLVCSHGHTVHHRPDEGVTIQIGNGKRIHEVLNLNVICDFRSLDVSMGGQGAPLVPIGDLLLFSKFNYCINLGGIANISFQHNNQRIAFDICGCNLILNHLVKETGKKFDNDGNLARSGVVNADLLNLLNSNPYHTGKGPKSLGKEDIWSYDLPIVVSSTINLEDKLATYVEYIAMQINEVIEEGKVLVTGGGVLNSFLLERLRIRSGSSVDFVKPDNTLIEFKEALIFGFLGVLKWRNEINVLASVTGGRKDSSSGTIYGS